MAAEKYDLVFEVEGKQIKCRRRALMEKSEYLRGYLQKNSDYGKISISNVPYEACEAVLRWMHSNSAPHCVISGDCPILKLNKVWELSLRFCVPELVEYCMGELERRMDANNVCTAITTLDRYPNLGIASLNNRFKRTCYRYLVSHFHEVQKTPNYFAMMGVAKIKAEVEAALEDPSFLEAEETRPPAPKGTAALLSKLKEQQQQQQQQPQQPLPTRSACSTPSLGPDVDEPVYEPVPVFHATTPAQDPVYDFSNISTGTATAAVPPPAPVPVAQAKLSTPSPRPSPRRAAPPPPPSVTSTAGVRVFDEMPLAPFPPATRDWEREEENRSPTPQPPAVTSPDADVVLEVQQADVPVQSGTRLATCVEAHTQRKLLRDLMDGIDGGFLASFLLEDGKVDGPGYGVPLRFATGDFTQSCAMRVIVRTASIPHPSNNSTARVRSRPRFPSPSPSVEQGTGFSSANTSANVLYDTEKDSLILKYYKLQQEFRVTSHELELFKNDYLDWEDSMKETNALRDVEEQKLRQRIMQQMRQLVNSVYGGRLLSETPVDAAPSPRHREEKEKLLRTLDSLKSSKTESKRLAAVRAEIEKVEDEMQRLEDVKGLIETELKENRQYEEYSKRYVCAVKSAEQEINGVLGKEENHCPRSMETMLRRINAQKLSGQQEVNSLDSATHRLRGQIEHECNHIRHIRSFLDETEHSPR